MGSYSGILYVDAYDSFSNNVISLLTQLLKTDVTSIKIDEVISEPLSSFLNGFAAVVIGPGPGHPENAEDIGVITRLWQIATERAIPVLGICLGFQTLCCLHGLPISRLPLPCHGHAKAITHVDDDIFEGVGVVLATCYNSLGVGPNILDFNIETSRPSSTGTIDSNSSNESISGAPFTLAQGPVGSHKNWNRLQPLAQDSDGYLMGVKHRTLPHWGLQFHSESCKSNLACHSILRNWWMLVACWNKQSRVAPSVPRGLVAFTDEISTSGVGSEGCLLPYLIRLSESSGPLVHSRGVVRKLLARQISDLCYQASSMDKVMFESTKTGRYSIYAMPSPSTFRIQQSQGSCKIYKGVALRGEWVTNPTRCLETVERLIVHRKAHGGIASLPFWGGFLGFIAYESLLDVEDKTEAATPDLSLLWTERSIVFDHVDCITTVQTIRRNDHEWVDNMVATIEGRIDHPSPKSPDGGFQKALRTTSIKLPNYFGYKSKIAACQTQLLTGNSYELCLTAEAQITLPANYAWPLYASLRLANPVPFAAFLHLGHTTILSSSPEHFLSWTRTGTLDMIPMKGTVRKSPTMTLARASALLSSPKEQAENLMIADLIRHDLHAALGPHAAVAVHKLCDVVEHETVYQLVSHIRAEAPIAVDASPEERQTQATHYGHAALRASFPPGSMTGAPKKRSCAILSQLETRARGVYSGVLGYLDVGGGGCFSVCIRSAFSNAESDAEGMQTWRVGAGGAITVLSDAEAEWEEMQTKLQSVLNAFRPDGNLEGDVV